MIESTRKTEEAEVGWRRSYDEAMTGRKGFAWWWYASVREKSSLSIMALRRSSSPRLGRFLIAIAVPFSRLLLCRRLPEIWIRPAQHTTARLTHVEPILICVLPRNVECRLNEDRWIYVYMWCLLRLILETGSSWCCSNFTGLPKSSHTRRNSNWNIFWAEVDSTFEKLRKCESKVVKLATWYSISREISSLNTLKVFLIISEHTVCIFITFGSLQLFLIVLNLFHTCCISPA